MAFETPITVESAVKNIESRKYLLPDIQRELVWNTEQIELLFDSLMREYPIGSFLFWEVDKEHAKDYKFYEFIRRYSELDSKHNQKANTNGKENIISILDGQQRLDALYIGLTGSYSYKTARRRNDDPLAYPIRKLYLNLRNDLSKQIDNDRDYDFKFLTENESKENNENTYWFEVGKILNLTEYDVNDYLISKFVMNPNDKEKSVFSSKTLFQLHSIIRKNQVINFYLEKSNELDKVLNIFIRVNNGGTKLNYTDLLLSMATAQWKNREAREEINRFVREINDIGNKFSFDKDFILRACLVLADVNDISFKINNFKKNTMLLIQEKWECITKAIYSAVSLISSFGYNKETLPSHNSIIPIAYYLLKIGLPNNFEKMSKYKEDRELIKKWLTRSLLKKVFGAHPENLYRAVRDIINDNKNGEFPLNKIVEKFKGTEKSIIFDDDEIENLFFYKYGEKYTFSALAMIYSNLDYKYIFDIDHIYPKSFFKKNILISKGIPLADIDFYMSKYNSLENLQLLEYNENREKGDNDFKEWLYRTYSEEERKEYMKKNYIPDNIRLDITNFRQFIEERHKLMFDAYKKII